jgi:OPA family glycerol-3-phosphate transporter-like MFS transporter
MGPTLGGILGGLSIGYLSDKLFQSRRAPIACVFFLLQVLSMFLLVKSPSMGFAAFMVMLNCIWAFGIHGIVAGTCSMDFGGTKGVATAGPLQRHPLPGASLSGAPLGSAIDKWGWNAWWMFIALFCLIGAALMMTSGTPLRPRNAHH